jgi:hypothetical protein
VPSTSLDHAGAEGRGHLVPAAQHHQCPRVEVGGVAQPGRDRPQDLVGGVDRSQLLELDAEARARLLAPAAAAEVEQHRRGGVRGVHRQLAGCAPGHERTWEQEPASSGMLVGAVVPQPADLGRDMAGVEIAAGELAQPLGRELVRRLLAFGHGAAVHPDERRPQGVAVGVGGDHAVELGSEGDRAHAAVGYGAAHLSKGPGDGSEPLGRILLGPAGMRI